MVDANLILGPRIQVPCEAAPQEGVHVYHFPFSSCSQMVRFALCAKEFQAWESHDIDIFSAMAHLVSVVKRCFCFRLCDIAVFSFDTAFILHIRHCIIHAYVQSCTSNHSSDVPQSMQLVTPGPAYIEIELM